VGGQVAQGQGDRVIAELAEERASAEGSSVEVRARPFEADGTFEVVGVNKLAQAVQGR